MFVILHYFNLLSGYIIIIIIIIISSSSSSSSLVVKATVRKVAGSRPDEVKF
jgi:hypothetical protein